MSIEVSIMTVVNRRTGEVLHNHPQAIRSARFGNLVNSTLKWGPRFAKLAGGIATARDAWYYGKPIRDFQQKYFGKALDMVYPGLAYPSRKRKGSSSKGSRKKSKTTKKGVKKVRKNKYSKKSKTKESKTVVHNGMYTYPFKIVYKGKINTKYMKAGKQKFLLKINGGFSNLASQGNCLRRL